jgi:hypothetical protein
MPTFTIDEHAPILVEFKPAAGVVRTAIPTSPADLAEQSRKALDAAMNTIHAMAERVNATIDAISDRPNKVEVEFGLKLDAQAGALVASASTEAGFNVKLTWERKEPSSALPEID